jgi:hypothetical protein
MTIEEIERIEECARRGSFIDPAVMLRVTSYLRDVLQEKANAEAVASAALSKAGLKSRGHSVRAGQTRRVS